MSHTTHRSLFTRPVRLLCVLAVLLVALFGLLSAGTAHAATTVTISDGTSCEAAGGTWTDRCTIGDFTVAADTTVLITVDTNFSSLTNYGTVTMSASVRSGTNALTNAAGAKLNIGAGFGLYAASSNAGTITISGSMGVVAPLTNTSTGQITIQSGAFLILLNALTNQGTITTICDGYVDYGGSGSLTGNPVQTSCPPPDTSAPVITPSISGTHGNNDWYTSDVSVSWTVTDDESALSDKTGCDTATITNDTSGTTITCSATSVGGTTSQSVTIKRDTTAPTIAYANRTAPNGNGWNTSPVTVNWTCSDATSGALSASVSQTVSAEGTNQSATGTCADNAGNSASDTQAGINIDKTAPVLNPVVSPNPVQLGSSATVTANASDSLSGIASQSCGALDTTSVGTKTMTCTATDNAGNTASASVTYQVGYRWSGFFQPIDNLPTVNSAKAGQAIPVKFSLGGNYGLNIFASGYPKVQQVACGSGAPTDEVEQTVTAGASGLTYDPASGQYTYTWKTDKKWAGSCRQLVIRLVDGSEHIALFQFK
jgi:hypothetical protein